MAWCDNLPHIHGPAAYVDYSALQKPDTASGERRRGGRLSTNRFRLWRGLALMGCLVARLKVAVDVFNRLDV